MASFSTFNTITNRKGRGARIPGAIVTHNADLVSNSPDGYRVYIYTTTGSTRNFSISGLQKDISINILCVGGGGGGGANSTNQSASEGGSGGGGGGGFYEVSDIIMNNDILSIIVGAGGSALSGTMSGSGANRIGNNGQNSKVLFQNASQNNIDVSGGGGGGGKDYGNNVPGSVIGNRGGSGGGGSNQVISGGRTGGGTINNNQSGLTVNANWGKNAPPMNEISTSSASTWNYIGGSGGGAGNLNTFVTQQVVGTNGGCYVRVNDGKISTLPGISSLYPNTYFAGGGMSSNLPSSSILNVAADSSGNLFRTAYGGGGGASNVQSGQYYFTLGPYSYTNYARNAAPNSGSGGSGVSTSATGTYTSGTGGSGIVMISILASLIS